MESFVIALADMGDSFPFNPTDVAFTINLYLPAIIPALDKSE